MQSTIAALLRSVSAFVAAACISACPQAPDIPSLDRVAPRLALTEVMINPDGEDSGREWVEILNTGSTEVRLSELRMTTGDDGFNQLITSAVLSPNASAIVVDDEVLASYFLAQGFTVARVDELELGNSEGSIRLSWGSELVSFFLYDASSVPPSAGDALQLYDGVWCASSVLDEATPGAVHASPGEPNPECQSVQVPDGPGPGDLRITEVLVNADGDDEGQEWFEVQNVSTRDVNMGGLTITTSVTGQVDDDAGIIAPGAFALIASSSDVTHDFVASMKLSNEAGQIRLESGGVRVDEVVWERGWPQEPGTSMWLPPSAIGADSGPDFGQWCFGRLEPMAPTPGAENADCDHLQTDWPDVGDLVVQELMLDAVGNDEDKEWVEVTNASNRDLLLDGIVLVDDEMRTSEVVEHGLMLAPGEFAVFANDRDAWDASALIVVDGEFRLSNTAGSLTIEAGGVAIDAVVWDAATWEIREGRSLSLSPEGASAIENDLSINWCAPPASTPGLANEACPDLPPLPLEGELHIVEMRLTSEGAAAAEWIEVLHTGDDVFSLHGMRLVNRDNDHVVIDAPDAVFAAGSRVVLAQTEVALSDWEQMPDVVYGSDFRLNKTNDLLALFAGAAQVETLSWNVADGWWLEGDGISQPESVTGEQPHAWCEFLASELTPKEVNAECERATAAPAEPGDLVVSEIMVDPKGTDEDHEWLEVYNPTDSPVQLGGLQLAVDGELSDRLRPRGAVVPPGSYAVIAHNADSTVIATAMYSRAPTMPDGGGEIELRRFDGIVIDRVVYDEEASGVATGISVGVEVPDSETNDDPTRWCAHPGRYANGDRGGTPGSANGACLVDTARLPNANELFVTEMMVNAEGSDDGKEWFELFNAGDEEVRLNGLVIETSTAEHTIDRVGLSIEPGAYVVLASSALSNPSSYVYDDVRLTNDVGELRLRDALGTQLASISWDIAEGWSTRSGRSLGLRPSMVPSDDQEASAWCLRGRESPMTPGEENGPCDVVDDDLFDPRVVHRWDLTLDQAQWTAAKADPWAKNYVDADLIVDGTPFTGAGVRFKGALTLQTCTTNGAISCRKPPLKVKFNHTDPDARFAGLRKAVLNANIIDFTYMHEAISYEIYRAIDVPTPRIAHTEVWINGDYVGVYQVVEHVDREFLEEHFEDPTGPLFKEVWPETATTSLIEDGAQSGEGHQGAMNDFQLATRGLLSTELALGAMVDWDAFGKTMAVDRFVGHTDGPMSFYCGPNGDRPCWNHNYYWYQMPSTGVWTLIPWDLDGSLWSVNSDFGQSWWDEAPRECVPMAQCDVMGLDPCPTWATETLLPYECSRLMNLQDPFVRHHYLVGLLDTVNATANDVPSRIIERCGIVADAVGRDAALDGADPATEAASFFGDCEWLALTLVGDTRSEAQIVLDSQGF